MMMINRNVLSILIVFISIHSYTQSINYKIIYERTNFKEYENGISNICPTILYLSPNRSVFLEDRVINGKSTEVSIENYRNSKRLGKRTRGDSLGLVIVKTIPEMKFKQRKRLISNKDFIYTNVMDSILPSFKWQIENEHKDILNFKCQKATTTYKGRKIVAWFNSNLGLSDGPWKFWNLPGLILEVKIHLDQEKKTHLVYEAVSIEQITSFPEIKLNPKLPSKELIVLEKEYQKVFEKQFKFFRTQSSGEVEIRVDDLDFEPIIFTTRK